MPSHDRAGIAAEVLAVLSDTVLKIGPLLDEAFESYQDFEAWVIDNLPLQPHTAERIRAYWYLHQFREGHPELPPPWQALWCMD